MSKSSSQYVCQSCGAAHPRWSGRCDACGAWNVLSEERVAPRQAWPGARPKVTAAGALTFVPLQGAEPPPPRLITGDIEFDRVTGGGLVPGSALLVGGDPGIGKSTLLLQIAASLARSVPCAYISGEEAVDQIRLRAARLGVADSPVRLAAATAMSSILASLEVPDGPRVVIIDSIQTAYLETLESAPGSVGQVRACAHELIRVAKARGIVALMVGHVTKDGAIAGPRVLEHMVDAVLYFEGDRGYPFRILRGVKNRFGPTSEIGVFDMTDRGLQNVSNPSALFLADRRDGVPGVAVFAGVEGTRPLLVEVQALVAPSPLGTPRRAVVGWDSARLAMVLAVLETRAGYRFSGKDVYLNVAGGLRISEPAADLAAAVALASALTGAPTPPDMVAFGEIGLSGDVRSVGQAALRLKEAAKLGFNAALTPRLRKRDGERPAGVRVTALSSVADLERLFA